MSEVLLGLFIFLIVAVVGLGGAHVLRLGRRPRAALLASLAGRWESRVQEGGIFRGDRVEIRVDGVAGEVTFGEETEKLPGWSHLRFDWRTERRLRIVPRNAFMAQVRRLLRGTELTLDDPTFDGLFSVESSHPAWARGILQFDVRRRLQELQRTASCQGPGGMTLYVGPAGVVLRVMHVLVDNSIAIESFIELGAAVLQRVRGRVDSEGVGMDAIRTGRGAACPVCGHPVGQGTTCGTCGTPHHADCWKYLGGCAIFGCQGKVKSRER